jgi:uncharacterized membrane protein
VAFRGKLSAAQKIGLLLAAISYVLAGALHFIQTDAYLRIMPPYIPGHLFMVRASGVCEILGGLGLLIRQTRSAAAWGLVALLVAVFPANIYMATNPTDAGAASIAPALVWGRLAVQPFLIWWVLWCTNTRLAFG